MKNREMEQFRWFIPRPKAQYFISIPNSSYLRFNEKLRAKVPDQVAIGISPDGKTIYVREQADGYKLPKNGTIHDEEIIAHLNALGIEVPAKYQVEEVDGTWVATWKPAPPLGLRMDGPARRRQKGRESILRELEAMK